jgi:uncharacterized protein (TIGR02453 family)
MVKTDFDGFPPELFEFLSALAANNNRSWFQANKSRYRDVVVEPMIQFITAMEPRLAAISEHFIADPRTNGGSMFRIYRDTRFSKDKRPYKENVGCQFRHRIGKDVHAPGFYVHLQPGEIFFGGGIWKPDGSTLGRIRETIVDNPVAWKKATTARPFQQRFDGLRGDSLQRASRGYSPEHPLITDLKRKSFFAMQQTDQAMACSPQLITEVDKAFRAVSPLMEFIAFALALPYSSRSQQQAQTHAHA